MNSAYKFACVSLVATFLFISCQSGSLQFVSGSQTVKWNEISKGTVDDAPTFWKVFFFSEQNGIALALTSIQGTTDGGKTWRTLHNFDDTVLSTFAVWDGEIWVIGGKYIADERTSPVIFKSNNGGTEWSQVDFDENSGEQIARTFSSFDSICFDKNRDLWLAGDGGTLKGEVTKNTVRIRQIPKSEKRIRRVFCGVSEIWGLGEEGTVAIFSEGHWKVKQLGADKSFTRVAFNGGHVWLTGTSISAETNGRGVLLRSKDGGGSWEDKTPKNALGLTDIYFAENYGWIVGIKGQIYSTVNGGETWSNVKGPTSSSLFSVFFFNSQNGWAVGERETVLRYSPAV